MSQLPRNNWRIALKLALGVILAIICLVPGAALGAPKVAGKVIIVTIDQASLQEIFESDAPVMKSLINRGALGLMSVRAGSNGDATAQYAALGAGEKAAGLMAISKDSGETLILEGFGAEERINGLAAADIYLARTGRPVSSPKAANLSISALIKANETGDYNGIPGLLGSSLHNAGLKTAAIGNADTQDTYGRSVIDIVMDKNGLVDFGYLDSSVLMRDAAFPSGYRSDAEKIEAIFAAAYAEADVIAVDWGDIARSNSDGDYMTLGHEVTLAKKSIARADTLIGRMLVDIDLSRDLLIIVSPTPNATDIKNNRIVTPVIMVGDELGKGLLTSPSTRREATIINTDIAPTVLRHFNLTQPTEMTGRAVTAGAYTGDKLNYALGLGDSWVAVRALMPAMLRGFAYWDIFILVLFVALLLRKQWRRWAVKLRWALLTVPAVPLAFLLLPLLGYGSFGLVMLETVILVAIIVGLVLWQARNELEAVGLIGLGVAATILIDLATGAHLMQNCMLGYSVLAGARFYGIGNEFAGVLTGSVLIGALYIANAGRQPASAWRKGLTIAFLAVPLAMMGAPNLGAEFGTLLADVAGFGLMALGIVRGGYKTKDISILAVLGLVGIFGFVAFDLSQGASGGSHVGRLVNQIRQEGSAPLFTIINRKIAMNVKLIQFAFWNWVNAVSVGVIALSFYSLKNLLKLVFQRFEYVKAALVGGLFCCVGALVLNDSGVVTMAMILLYLVPSALYLVTFEIK